MRKGRALAGGFGALLGLLACGKPEARDNRLWVADVSVAGALAGSRAAAAGCMQWVREGSNQRLEFSNGACAKPGKPQPFSSVRFSLAVDPSEKAALLRFQNVSVGSLRKEETGAWVLDHLCQISEPGLTPDLPFDELCQIKFKAEAGQSRYESIQLFTLEEVARSKVGSLSTLEMGDQFHRQKIIALDTAVRDLREELRRAEEAREAAAEALTDARRGLGESFAVSFTANQKLERTEAEASLKLAEADAQLVKLEIKFAAAEKSRLGYLKERLAYAENAARLDKGIRAQLQANRGLRNSIEEKLFLSTLDQLKGMLLDEDQARLLNEEIGIATGEADRLEDLENKKLPAIIRLVKERKDAFEKLKQMPPTPTEAKPVPTKVSERETQDMPESPLQMTCDPAPADLD
ncbi:hypothetical protein K2X33_00310 [bacterium]|nr:hypothetical protein [bacterium]